MTNLDSLADAAFVINLDSRSDRWQRFEQVVAPSLAPIPVYRVNAINGQQIKGFGKSPYFRGRKRDTTWAGRGGCLLSHRAAIQRALESDLDRALILEDDAYLDDTFGALVALLQPCLKTLRWDVCYLGFTDPIHPCRPIQSIGTSKLFEIYGCNTAHAYLLKREAMQTIFRELPDESTIWPWLTRHRAIDRWYARFLSRHLRVLALSPSVVLQQEDISSITGRSSAHNHPTWVGDERLSTNYQLARNWRRVHHALEGGYDALRGWIKRQRGF